MKSKEIYIDERHFYYAGEEVPTMYFNINIEDERITELSYDNLLAIRKLIDLITKRKTEEEQK